MLTNPGILDLLDLTGPLAVRSIERAAIAKPFRDWLEQHDLLCLRALVFYRSGPNTPSVHRDMRLVNGVSTPAYAALNFQLHGVGRMDFYHMPQDNQTVYDTSARTAYQAWSNDATLERADSLLFDAEPALVRVDVPHRIESLTESRTSISIRFAPRGQQYLDSWQQALDHLAPSIISRKS